jgi:hypothetical protein
MGFGAAQAPRQIVSFIFDNHAEGDLRAGG